MLPEQPVDIPAWCVWEMFCTAEDPRCELRVALPPAAKAEFEQVLFEGGGAEELMGYVRGVNSKESEAFNAGATALAAGTFLYIGAFDLVQDQFLLPARRWAKWLSAVAGAALAGLVTLWL